MSDFLRSLKQTFRDAAAWWRIVSHWPGGALIDLHPRSGCGCGERDQCRH